MSKARILIVDDNKDILQALRLFLKQHGFQAETEERPIFLPQLLKNERYDLILLDMNFARDSVSGKEGFFWLKHILKADPSAVVILMTAYGDVEMAVKAMKEGATDFVQKPWQNEKLLATISASLQLRKSKLQVEDLKERQKELNRELDKGYQEIIGRSEAIQRVFDTIDKVAKTDANVLILGENGTGKELIARALHRKSSRVDNAFVSVDMGAITETLFESELFGHVKGAFTDAKNSRIGRFELANEGTLFLDEIGNLSLPLQAKLLTAIQNRRITKVGSNQVIPVDIRLISATNMPVYQMVGEHQFRQDLLYRINTVEIHLPPLRDRKDDIPLLANHFLQEYAQKYKKAVHSISASALRRMEKYNWPGNIRELQHTLERALIMTESEVLQPNDFFFTTQSEAADELQLDTYNLEEVEKLLIRKAISKSAGNISQAAKELGLTRSSLYRRIEKYGL